MVAWVGINYDTGTRYGRDASAPSSCDGYDVDRALHHDLATIADDLHCNAVQLFGTDIERLTTAATRARSLGLQVWFQPRVVDATPEEHLIHLAAAAAAAETVRAEYGGVVLSVGVEISLFLQGFPAGDTVADRIGSAGFGLGGSEGDGPVGLDVVRGCAGAPDSAVATGRTSTTVAVTASPHNHPSVERVNKGDGQ
jgi:hypothetical protein